MTFVDLLIGLLVISSGVHGFFQGAALQVLAFGGFWGGLLLGAALAPVFTGFAQSSGAKVLLGLLSVFGLAMIGGAVGRFFGLRAWGRLQQAKMGTFDSGLGSVVGGASTLLAAWLIGVMLAGLPVPTLSRAIQESVILDGVGAVMPPAPDVFSRLRNLFDKAGFPQVFAEFEPSPAPEVQLPSDPQVRAAVEAAGRSTVRIRGVGCGGVQSGSGWVGASGMVVTNAHVIAGIDNPQVEDANGRHDAVPVLFDPDLDMAVLRTSGLAGGPLELVTEPVGRGGGTAVMGFPGGGQFRAGPAAVRDRFTATGRDIYGRGLVRRDVYQLQATIRSGNSGGPFVDRDGRVLGLVFSRSAYRDDVGYAITGAEVAPRLSEARGRQGAVDTGSCVN